MRHPYVRKLKVWHFEGKSGSGVKNTFRDVHAYAHVKHPEPGEELATLFHSSHESEDFTFYLFTAPRLPFSVNVAESGKSRSSTL
ncbi:hypothetical protein POVWA1_005610 [Plasmodium ovale wallikeri]|uniref:Uncharacterized protein n=1 Tax=Plasmodium ovale wallikeri TaxID=864142 RepID=A0A1A8YHU8_PLAOA|nr:hypothetical protein POVWA1_005610 [Plasmodium ovale wallikeri]